MNSTYYVAHSPYPDGTWRGIEKCACDKWGTLIVWETEEEVWAWIRDICGTPDYWVPVAVGLFYPDVRAPLTSGHCAAGTWSCNYDGLVEAHPDYPDRRRCSICWKEIELPG